MQRPLVGVITSHTSPAYEARPAERTWGFTSSVIREIIKVATRPDVTSFAAGLPAPDLFQLAAFREAADKFLSQHGSTALQGGATDGVLCLRQHIAASESDDEAQASATAGLAAPPRIAPDEVMMITGS